MGYSLFSNVGKGETQIPTSICYYCEFIPFDNMMIKISDTEANIIASYFSLNLPSQSHRLPTIHPIV